MWAVWAADGVHRLLDLDDEAFGVMPREMGGYSEEALDLSHVRWASASAITTLDLCAGTLGRRRCPPRKNEYSLRSFDPMRARHRDTKEAAQARLDELQPEERTWVEAATTDADYAIVLSARNPMTHGRLKRTLYGNVVPPRPHENRTGFPVGPGDTLVHSRPLIELCSKVATHHLEDFLTMIAAQP